MKTLFLTLVFTVPLCATSVAQSKGDGNQQERPILQNTDSQVIIPENILPLPIRKMKFIGIFFVMDDREDRKSRERQAKRTADLIEELKKELGYEDSDYGTIMLDEVRIK